MYNELTTGEKRSITSSLKKVQDLFVEETQGDFLSYGTKDRYVNAIYSFWVDYSTKQKLSWCKDESRLQDATFKNDMLKKIEEMHEYEISVLQKAVQTVQPKKEVLVDRLSEPMENIRVKQVRIIRSKKKRIRKKYEKLLALNSY